MEKNSKQGFREHLTSQAIDTVLDNNTGPFSLKSEFRRIAVAYPTFFGAARAISLQIAHPTVAQGIYDHSAYDKNPTERVIRTFIGILAIALGKQDYAINIGCYVYSVHTPIKGNPPGLKHGMSDRPYSAMEPSTNL